MSGGKFLYYQYHITMIADEIENRVKNNNIKDEWGNTANFSDEILALFRDGVKALRIAEVYAQRIDWLLSGDDGEETFAERLKEDLEKCQKEGD
jgi:hypothetical protein